MIVFVILYTVVVSLNFLDSFVAVIHGWLLGFIFGWFHFLICNHTPG